MDLEEVKPLIPVQSNINYTHAIIIVAIIVVIIVIFLFFSSSKSKENVTKKVDSEKPKENTDTKQLAQNLKEEFKNTESDTKEEKKVKEKEDIVEN